MKTEREMRKSRKREDEIRRDDVGGRGKEEGERERKRE